MTGGNSRASRDRLRFHWSRWTAIVALFARRRPARRRVDSVAYAALRNELIAVCRSLAEEDGERRAYYTALEETVRPWLSPRALARTDRELLFMLLDHCREVERELGGRRWVPNRLFHFNLVPWIATGAVVFGLAWFLLEFGLPVLEALRDLIATAWLTIQYSSNFLKLSVLAVVLVVASSYAISRTARS
jgi:hypothetical protein